MAKVNKEDVLVVRALYGLMLALYLIGSLIPPGEEIIVDKFPSQILVGF